MVFDKINFESQQHKFHDAARTFAFLSQWSLITIVC